MLLNLHELQQANTKANYNNSKIPETNSSFQPKGKSLISIFQDFSSSINKTVILARRLGTKLSFYEV